MYLQLDFSTHTHSCVHLIPFNLHSSTYAVSSPQLAFVPDLKPCPPSGTLLLYFKPYSSLDTTPLPHCLRCFTSPPPHASSLPSHDHPPVLFLLCAPPQPALSPCLIHLPPRWTSLLSLVVQANSSHLLRVAQGRSLLSFDAAPSGAWCGSAWHPERGEKPAQCQQPAHRNRRRSARELCHKAAPDNG